MKKLAIHALAIWLLAIAASTCALGRAAASNPDALTGTWDCASHGGEQGDTKFTLALQQDGEKVTGSVASEMGGMGITAATFKNDELEIHLDTPQGDYVLAAKLKDGELAGSVKLDGKEQGTWKGKKAAASANKSTP